MKKKKVKRHALMVYTERLRRQLTSNTHPLISHCQTAHIFHSFPCSKGYSARPLAGEM